MGCHVPSTSCCSTAPTADSDASVMRQVSASSLGYESRVALARASFVALNDATAVSFQTMVWVLLTRSACRGCMSSAQWDIKR